MNFSVPHSQAAEEAVIGAVLVNPGVYSTLAAFLKPDDFYITRHSTIWEVLGQLYNRDESLDYVTLIETLSNARVGTSSTSALDSIGGEVYLLGLLNNTASSVHAEVYGHLVQRAAMRRRLMNASDEIRGLALREDLEIDAVLTQAEKRLFDVTERQTKRDLVPIRDVLSAYYDQIELMRETQSGGLGVPTGFNDLDELLGGLQKSDLLIFAGRPGMGKCLTGDTLIHTANGPVPLLSLKPCDAAPIMDGEGGWYTPLQITVHTPYGPRLTSHFYDSGVQPTLCLTTCDGRSIVGTHAHRLLTRTPHGRAWLPLCELRAGDVVAVLHDAAAPNPMHTEPFHAHGDGAVTSAQPPAVNAPASAAAVMVSEAAPTLAWVAIAQIADAGEQHCYDLTVPDGHAFIANGIVNHNTSFLLSIALNAARRGARTALFTMEMGAEQIVQRLISMEMGVDMKRLRLGQLDNREWSRFVETVKRLAKLNIFIDDSPALNPLQLRTKCRRLAHEFGVDMVMLDYLQLMNAGGTGGFENNRVQEISYISRNLKELARELNAPLLSAAQLSRAVEGRADKRPMLSDLRESGSIEQDADVVMFLYRDEVYNEATEFPNQAEVIVSKHRNGPTGTISLYFQKQTMKFMDASVSSIDMGAL
jgi:replicative DNA helicase